MALPPDDPGYVTYTALTWMEHSNKEIRKRVYEQDDEEFILTYCEQVEKGEFP